jgi:hypothetical protein
MNRKRLISLSIFSYSYVFLEKKKKVCLFFNASLNKREKMKQQKHIIIQLVLAFGFLRKAQFYLRKIRKQNVNFIAKTE